MKIVISNDFIVRRSWGAPLKDTVANKDTIKMKFFIFLKRLQDEINVDRMKSSDIYANHRELRLYISFFKQLSFIFTRYFAVTKNDRVWAQHLRLHILYTPLETDRKGAEWWYNDGYFFFKKKWSSLEKWHHSKFSNSLYY